MRGTWTHETIAGKPADVYQPPHAEHSRFGILFLHPVGNETLRGRTVYTRLLDELALPCVCPMAPFTWWTDRMCTDFDPTLTAERHVLQNVLPFFAQRWRLAPRSIGLLGISMGGQGALRLALKHPRTFPVAAGIASALDYYEWYGQGLSLDSMYDSKEQCRQDTAVMHVHPSESPPHIYFAIDPEDVDWYRGNDRLHEKLGALGVPHTIDFTTSAGGHTWAYFDRMAEPALRFIAAGLEKESRRLM
jgi:pimeloyl-ACP methyl ester carboxylesterase